MPSASSTVTPSSSWLSPTSSQPRRISAPSSVACSVSRRSVTVCGMPRTYGCAVSSRSGARLVDAGEETADRVLLAEREEPLQQTALVHHLDAAHVQAERADNLGRLRVLLQHEHVHAVQPQLAGQHQAGRSAAGNDHVNHEYPHYRLHFGQLLRAVRWRAHPHLRAEWPQPHRESHRRFDLPRDPHVDKNTRTSRIPDLRLFCLRPAILRHDPGLAARLPVRYTLKVARSA